MTPISEAMIEKQLPQNLDAERAVLCAILLDGQAIGKALEILHVQDFYKPAHRTIAMAMQALDAKCEAIDLVTLTEQLRSRGELDLVGGVSYLSELFNAIPTAAHIRSHATIVHQKAMLRNLISTTDQIRERCYEPKEAVDALLDSAEKQIFEITDRNIRSGFIPMKTLVRAGFEIIEKLADKKITGISTGFADLDKETSGLQASDLIIIAGRPSMGKTAFALGLAQNLALRGSPHTTSGGGPMAVGIFSLEMSKEQICFRMLCSEARVDAHKIRTGYLGRPGNENWTALIDAAGRLHDAPIFIDDSTDSSIFQMRAKARRLKATTPLGLIIVDYLQLISGRSGSDNREREIAEISRSLKGLAKELQVPVVALSQLNRGVETRDKKRPILADLRESGAIEQDADVVMFIHRPEVYQPCTCPHDGECLCGRRGVAEIIIGKQRNGPIGTVKLAFINKYTRFDNLDRDHPAHHAA